MYYEINVGKNFLFGAEFGKWKRIILQIIFRVGKELAYLGSSSLFLPVFLVCPLKSHIPGPPS